MAKLSKNQIREIVENEMPEMKIAEAAPKADAKVVPDITTDLDAIAAKFKKTRADSAARKYSDAAVVIVEPTKAEKRRGVPHRRAVVISGETNEITAVQG